MIRSAAFPLNRAWASLLDHLAPCPLAHADKDRPVPDGHDIAAFQRETRMAHTAALISGFRLRGPVPEACIHKRRVMAVDGANIQCLRLAGGPVHRVDGDPVADPGLRNPG